MVDLSEIVKENTDNYEISELYFDTIPIKKVVGLSILTFGIYEMVWFYKCWKTLATKFGHKISPFWRALFCGFSGFWLFPILEKYIKSFGLKAFVGSTAALAYFLLNALYKLPDPWWLICFLSIIIIAVVQDKINKVNEQYFPNATLNKWSGINTFWAIIGGIMLFLALIGTFIPE